MLINNKGWLVGIDDARLSHIPSPNFNERPDDMPIDLLVIHNISLPPGEFGGPGITALFTNSIDLTKECFSHPCFKELKGDVEGEFATKVAAHMCIFRDGSIVQYVPFNKRAWHAGVSSFKGREGCNDFSIGIELEGSDFVPFEDIQYETLKDVTKAIQEKYGISVDRITGHSDIAPGRKTDPGPHFDWGKYKFMIRSTIDELK